MCIYIYIIQKCHRAKTGTRSKGSKRLRETQVSRDHVCVPTKPEVGSSDQLVQLTMMFPHAHSFHTAHL